MAKKFIILGELNRKHLLPLLLVVYQIIYKIFNKYYPEKKQNNVLNMFTTSLGMMSIIFFKCIFKLQEREEQKEKELHKRKWLHYLLLIVIFLIYTIMKSVVIIMKVSGGTSGDTQVVNPFSEGPFVNIGIEMILLTVASRILLKYKYFIHHVISIAGFILFGNFSDILLGYYPQIIKLGVVINIVQIISILIDVIHYYYQKYMMEILFYPYWKITFILGVTFFFIPTAYLIYVLAAKDKANNMIINSEYFYSYFEDLDVGIMIGRQLMNFIFASFSTVLNILNIYYFNPNYVLISFQFSKFVEVLLDEEDNKKYYCIIFFVFQLFCLLIYLEILELNFCNLNNNTKRNIELRSILDSTGESGRDSTVGIGAIDINSDYTIISENGDDKNIEMYTQ